MEEEEGEGEGEDPAAGPTSEDGVKYLQSKKKYYKLKQKFSSMILTKATITLNKSKEFLKMMEKEGDTDKIIDAELRARKAEQKFSAVFVNLKKTKSMLKKVETQEKTGLDFIQSEDGEDYEEEEGDPEAAAAKAKAAEAKLKLDKANGLVPKIAQKEKSKAPSKKKENLKDILDDGDEDEFAEVLTVEEKKLLGMRIGRGRAGEGGAKKPKLKGKAATAHRKRKAKLRGAKAALMAKKRKRYGKSGKPPRGGKKGADGEDGEDGEDD
jgi:hypothetical protein